MAESSMMFDQNHRKLFGLKRDTGKTLFCVVILYLLRFASTRISVLSHASSVNDQLPN